MPHRTIVKKKKKSRDKYATIFCFPVDKKNTHE